MFVQLKVWLVRRRFLRATAAYDRAIRQARSDHGRVRDAQRAKSDAVHDAMRRGLPS